MDKKGSENSKFSGLSLPKTKKGAIELSITGVIVLIIAITVLGLILNFVREYFIKVEPVIKKSFDELKEDVYKKMKTGKDLEFSGGEILRVSGGAQEEALGIRNTLSSENPICHRVEFVCKRAFTGEGCDNTLVGGRSLDGKLADKEWFSTQDDWDIDAKEAQVKPVDVKLEEVRPGKYSMVLNVYRANGDCEKSDFAADAKPWKDHKFTLDVQAD
ncbi:hypothetical protein HY837_02030 [archaeon]|nr:hypothetical protein [archaeon]